MPSAGYTRLQEGFELKWALSLLEARFTDRRDDPIKIGHKILNSVYSFYKNITANSRIQVTDPKRPWAGSTSMDTKSSDFWSYDSSGTLID